MQWLGCTQLPALPPGQKMSPLHLLLPALLSALWKDMQPMAIECLYTGMPPSVLTIIK